MEQGSHDIDDSPGEPQRGQRIDEVMLVALASASSWGWYQLYRWYGLPAHQDTTHFAFEKIPGGFDSSTIRYTAAIFVMLTVTYGLGFWIVRVARELTRRLKAGIALSIAGPVLANVMLYPVGALDVFNYMIELKLAFHFDQNPYLTTFAAYRDDPFALPAFLVDVKLFYGPAWLLGSWLPAAIGGFDDVVTLLLTLKIFNALLIGLTGWLIAWHQRDERKGWAMAYLFVANPLVLFEGVANAHNDVMMTCLLVGAVAALARKSPVAGPLLALATLVKFPALVIAPFLAIGAFAGRWSARRVALAVGLTVAATVLVVAPFWSGGEMLDGFREGLERSQEMDHVSLYSLAMQREQQGIAERSGRETFVKSRPSAEILTDAEKSSIRNRFAFAFLLLAGLVALGVARGRPLESGAAATLMLLSILLTNMYPWYLIPIFALLAMRLELPGLVFVIGATALGLVYYPAYVFVHFNSGWERYDRHLFLAVLLTVPIVLYLVVELIRSGRLLWPVRFGGTERSRTRVSGGDERAVL